MKTISLSPLDIIRLSGLIRAEITLCEKAAGNSAAPVQSLNERAEELRELLTRLEGGVDQSGGENLSDITDAEILREDLEADSLLNEIINDISKDCPPVNPIGWQSVETETPENESILNHSADCIARDGDGITTKGCLRCESIVKKFSAYQQSYLGYCIKKVAEF